MVKLSAVKRWVFMRYAHFRSDQVPFLLLLIITMTAIAVFVQYDRMRHRAGDTRAKAYLQTPTGVRVEAEEMSLSNVSKDPSGSYIEFDSTSPIQISTDTLVCPPSGEVAGSVATMDVDLNEHSNYRMWIQLKSKGNNRSSVWLRIDDHYCVKLTKESGVGSNKWVWVDYQNGDPSVKIPTPLLGTGHHIVQFIGNANEPGLGIDRFLMMMNDCIPDGNGDVCIGIVPTPTPTPTPTPAQATTVTSSSTTTTTTTSKPVIVTDSLPNGAVGVSYQASVVAKSDTPSGTLGMTAQHLPDGIELQSCQLDSGFGGATLTCPLTGTPTKKSVNNPSFSVIDGAGNKTQKTIKIKVD